MNSPRSFVLVFLGLMLLQCDGKQSPKVIEITAPTGVQIFRQPQAGLVPPFLYTSNIFERKLAYTDTIVIPAAAGDEFSGQVMEALNSQYKADLEVAATNASVAANVSKELASQVNFTVAAHGLKVYVVSPSDVKFKGGTDLVSYLTSFKDNNSRLVLETFSADSITITASNMHSEQFKAALRASLGDRFKANFDMMESGEGKTSYSISGRALVYGYTAASLQIELYSADKPLNIDAPIGQEVDFSDISGVEWIRAIRVDHSGDGQSYLIRIYPKFGDPLSPRLGKGDQKEIAIGNRLILTIAVKEADQNNVKLSIVGFNLTFKGN